MPELQSDFMACETLSQKVERWLGKKEKKKKMARDRICKGVVGSVAQW